jgi:hypothetical protein
MACNGHTQSSGHDPKIDSRPSRQLAFELGPHGRVFLQRVDKRALKTSRFERMRGTATSSMTTEEIMALTRGAE